MAGMAQSRQERPHRTWERKWRQHGASEFAWETEEPPAELSRLLETGALPAGAGLDLGCGAGAATSHISRFLAPTVGVDVAMEALHRARSLARETGAAPTFTLAEAPTLPFRDGVFALIFDRGCLHNIARPLWPAYFREIDRLLAPGGMFQLFVVRPTLPPPLSLGGIRVRLRHPRRIFRTQRTRSMLFDQRLRSHLPPSLRLVEKGETLFDRGGRRRTFVHLLVRKAG